MGRGSTGKAAAPDSDEPRTRLLWELIRPRLPLFGLATLAGLIATGARLGTPLATKHILDSVNGKASMTGPLGILVVLVAIGAVAVVLLLGLGNMLRGGSPDTSQKLMRLRVLQRQRISPLSLRTSVTSPALWITTMS